MGVVPVLGVQAARFGPRSLVARRMGTYSCWLHMSWGAQLATRRQLVSRVVSLPGCCPVATGFAMSTSCGGFSPWFGSEGDSCEEVSGIGHTKEKTINGHRQLCMSAVRI